MEKKSLRSIFFRRILHGQWKMDIKGIEAVFLVLFTLVAIGFPTYFLFTNHKIDFPLNMVVLFGTLFALFFIFMDLDTFFKSNYIDFLFFQICTFVILMLIVLVFFIVKRKDIAIAVALDANFIGIWLVAVICYLIFLVGSFICVSVIDFIVVMVLLLLAYIFQINLSNPYIEKLQYAQSIEGSKEYTKKRIREDYENRFQEANIDETTFEKYCKEQNYKEIYESKNRTYIQEPLFDHTKHFKHIVSLDQVTARYDTLMKIYKPDDDFLEIPEICKEIEEEYKEIKKKYNINDK